MASSAECGMGDTGANRERKLKRNGDPYGERFQGEEERMGKPRIFLGSSGKQEKLLQALTRGLEDVAHVEPWTDATIGNARS